MDKNNAPLLPIGYLLAFPYDAVPDGWAFVRNVMPEDFEEDCPHFEGYIIAEKVKD